jgi:hypothetical protein
MALCLQLLGDTVVRAPTSPTNARGAIDSSEEALGPIYVDHPETVGAGQTNLNALAQTTPFELRTATGLSLQVRATTIVLAASHGLTDDLDASVVLPVLVEGVSARLHADGLSGHTSATFSGPSDLGVRLKYRLAPGLAATLEATFPTGDRDKGLGVGAYWLSPGLVGAYTTGQLQLSGRVAFDVNLSRAAHSTVSYGVGASYLVWPRHLALVSEVVGQSAVDDVAEQEILGIDYAARHTLDLVFGVRVPLGSHLMLFAAGSYAVISGGLRADGVFPTLGIGGTF